MHPQSRILHLIISLLLAASTASSLAASVLVARLDLPTAISLPSSLSGEIVGDDPTVVSRATPPQERAREDRPYPLDVTSSSNNTRRDEEPDLSLPIISFEPQSALTPRADVTNEIPTAFDTNISNNFTSKSCPNFFKTFRADSTFANCHALSCLLRDSNSFFYTLRSAPATSHLLDLACSADFNKCSKKMSELASSLLKDENCGKDYKLGHPVVTDAYTDFITYKPIYRATCLKSPTTNDYCFVDAVTNKSNPADYNVYSVAFGSTLTSAPYPTCNQCLQATMEVFGNWAKVAQQPLVNSYLPSARGVNSKCGDGFANVNITVGVEKAVSAGLRLTPAGSFVGYILALITSMILSELF
ncbi:hypothetical protein BDV59DRAFT_166325 [Aspergillus ambiguus]|uniref:uncharacterized protein n=1 Tax=Aspergillus ambiguus TaxID=176160 RepID=UPI003CCE4A5F